MPQFSWEVRNEQEQPQDQGQGHGAGLRGQGSLLAPAASAGTRVVGQGRRSPDPCQPPRQARSVQSLMQHKQGPGRATSPPSACLGAREPGPGPARGSLLPQQDPQRTEARPGHHSTSSSLASPTGLILVGDGDAPAPLHCLLHRRLAQMLLQAPPAPRLQERGWGETASVTGLGGETRPLLGTSTAWLPGAPAPNHGCRPPRGRSTACRQCRAWEPQGGGT